MSRLRAGGEAVAKARLLKEINQDPGDHIVSNKKLRIAGLPNRKAARLGRKFRQGLSNKKR